MGITKKDQILEAAIDCFTTYGYEKTSMSDIGKRVGLNKASLYYHFKDKLSLFDAMVEIKRDRHRVELRKLLKNQELGIPQIISFLCAEIDFIEILAVNFLAPPSSNKNNSDDTMVVFKKIIDEDLNTLETLIQSSIDAGVFKQIDVKKLAYIVLQSSRGLLMVDCPLDMPKSQRGMGYNRVRDDIKQIIPLILKGATG